jgi:hypothetical protein
MCYYYMSTFYLIKTLAGQDALRMAYIVADIEYNPWDFDDTFSATPPEQIKPVPGSNDTPTSVESISIFPNPFPQSRQPGSHHQLFHQVPIRRETLRLCHQRSESRHVG